MNSRINIELFEEHSKVNFYTLRFYKEETEVDKFFDMFPEGCNYDEDIDIIIKWIDKIGERGALERYLRPEGKQKDNVWAIPIETNNLRLYVLKLSDYILILGNGGIKTTSNYNEDAYLNSCVELLQELDGYIKSRISNGQITLYNKQIFGNTTFHLKANDVEK
ncbi:hypothetical protein CYCD_18130 [Tenuifilaceae bacterium CYCD]|nr:hypothetical protein CYCD_18130 [Tenuifilaceae bacterium CYCD]